jgi:hypothetical protein
MKVPSGKSDKMSLQPAMMTAKSWITSLSLVPLIKKLNKNPKTLHEKLLEKLLFIMKEKVQALNLVARRVVDKNESKVLLIQSSLEVLPPKRAKKAVQIALWVLHLKKMSHNNHTDNEKRDKMDDFKERVINTEEIIRGEMIKTTKTGLMTTEESPKGKTQNKSQPTKWRI